MGTQLLLTDESIVSRGFIQLLADAVNNLCNPALQEAPKDQGDCCGACQESPKVVEAEVAAAKPPRKRRTKKEMQELRELCQKTGVVDKT